MTVVNLLIAMFVWCAVVGALGAVLVVTRHQLRKARHQLGVSRHVVDQLGQRLAWVEDLREAGRQQLEQHSILPRRGDPLEELFAAPAVVPPHDQFKGER